MVRRIRIWADTHSSGLIDELGRSVPHRETTISEATWNRLQQWVEEYDRIIPLGSVERAALVAEIQALDRRGLDLLAAISKEWPADNDGNLPILFSYYSEGLMREIPVALDGLLQT